MIIKRKIRNVITINELALLTGVTRQTISSYIKRLQIFDEGNNVPIAFKKLFTYICNNNPSRYEIVEYCKCNFDLKKCNDKNKIKNLLCVNNIKYKEIDNKIIIDLA